MGWYTGTYEQIAHAKQAFMLKGNFHKFLKSFPPELALLIPTAEKIRGILFPMRDDDLFTGTSDDPTELYDPIIQALKDAVDL